MSGRHRGLTGMLALVLATTASRPALAQLGCSGSVCTVEVAMPVSDVLRISLSTSGVLLGTPTEADYAIGYRDVIGPAVTVTVKANRAFQVQVIGGAASFGYTGPHPDPAKAASELLWSISQPALAGTGNHMGIAGMLMNQGPSANAQASVYLRTLWNFARDVPGSYSIPIRFTLSAP